MELQMDTRIGVVSALCCYFVVTRELSQKAKLPINQSIYVPNLIDGHKLLEVTERTISSIQVAENGFPPQEGWAQLLMLRSGTRTAAIAWLG